MSSKLTKIKRSRKKDFTQPSEIRSVNGKVNHDDALRMLVTIEAVKKAHPPNTICELPAIVSHWLQSPGKKPIMLDRETRKFWSNLLSTYAQIGTSPILDNLEPSSRSPFTVDYKGCPFPPLKNPKFSFIDLFAGIGGFRLALQKFGGKCVFSSEWDYCARETYRDNYGEVPFGDIRQFTAENISNRALKKMIPDHDVLAAGFPCQPFSRAGVSARKALGKKHGFSCDIQGTLFFDLMRIAKVKQPKVIFLENVRNLERHDGGRTFKRIKRTIEKELKYSFSHMVIDSSPMVPQRRKRCYIVCLRKKRDKFEFPKIKGPPKPLKSILQRYVPAKFTISNKLWQGHINRTKRNIARGVGFTAYEADLNKPASTLVARYYKDGKECLIPQHGKNPRMLTPRECARLQGYPEAFRFYPTRAQSYRQFGNSVAVPVVRKIAKRIAKKLLG